MSPTQSSVGRAPAGRKPGGSSKSFWEKFWLPIIVGVLVPVIVAGITSGFFKDLLGPRATPTPLPATIKILSLQDGQQVANQIASVEGTYSYVKEDETIWLLVAAGGLCYPQAGPAEKLAAGRWSHGPVQFSQSGEIRLQVVLAAPAAKEQLTLAFGRKGVGIRCDQPGVELKDSITLTVLAAQAATATMSAPTGEASSQPSSPTTPVIGSPRVEFIYPLNETEVKQTRVSNIRGRFSGFATGDELWLVVFVGSNIFVQDGPALLTLADGTWFYRDVYFGTDQDFVEPQQFRLFPVIVQTSEARRWFREHTQGGAVQELPAGATMLSPITVTRVNFSTPVP